MAVEGCAVSLGNTCIADRCAVADAGADAAGGDKTLGSTRRRH